jgi:F-type H+-transporting ATPase subunit epsilon
MQLEILTPERKIFSGTVHGVQLPGTDGSFEVLDKHAAIIASLGKGKMKVLKDKNSFDMYEITGGFIEVINNTASVLLEDAKAI